MIVKLKDGFEVELLEESLDDWDLMEDFYDIDEGNHGKIVGVARKLFGTEGVKKLKEHLKDANGKVTGTAMAMAIQEIFDAANELKNS